MAVFAPMPSASVSTDTAVKPGFFTSWRIANLRSFMTQRLHGIDLRGSARGQPAGAQGDHRLRSYNNCERQQVGRTNSVKERANEPRQGKRPGEADHDTCTREGHPLVEDHFQHIALLGSERDSNANLARAL